VSAPITWDEVRACRQPERLAFTADDVRDRVDHLGDLFASIADMRAALPVGKDALADTVVLAARFGRLRLLIRVLPVARTNGSTAEPRRSTGMPRRGRDLPPHQRCRSPLHIGDFVYRDIQPQFQA
jgi:hypothetical protein